MPIPSERWEELWRWLGLTVAGSVMPFLISAFVYLLETGRSPTAGTVLGSGGLFIPSSIMNAEALWFFTVAAFEGKRKFWYPIVVTACVGGALGGAVAYGAVAALVAAPANSIKVSSATLRELMKIATSLSVEEFGEALVLGALGVTLYLRYGRRKRAGS